MPADLVILAAACEPEPENPAGICYMETKSLDGETNLKLHHHIEAMYTTLLSDDQVADLTGVVVCETPNSSIHRFDGEVMIFQQQKRTASHLKSDLAGPEVLLKRSSHTSRLRTHFTQSVGFLCLEHCYSIPSLALHHSAETYIVL